MAKKRKWHPKFIQYMADIINHPNYKGLPIVQKKDGSYAWVATAESPIGQQRIEWCKEKASQLDFPIESGVYGKVMLAIHPTKKKICQICGKEMSLYYHYPSNSLLKAISKQFEANYTECDHISFIWDDLLRKGNRQKDIAKFLIKKGHLQINEDATKDVVIQALEQACRLYGKKCLGPGAMSNFPDRYDGFHSYNRCCRSTQDKGRSKENLKSYTKDRRAYEYWSDGNIHAANKFMGSKFFKNTSADHIGPISLGFVHDPRFLKPMPSSDNSAKRDRLQIEDIESMIAIEKRTNICAISWYSRDIWEHIKLNYKTNPHKVPTVYRDALKQNLTNFMFILWHLKTSCSKKGYEFLTKAFLIHKFEYFNYSYKFDANGNIMSKTVRNKTASSKNELSRCQRIAMESIDEYMGKDNRNLQPYLTPSEEHSLDIIKKMINHDEEVYIVKKNLIKLISEIQKRLILSI